MIVPDGLNAIAVIGWFRATTVCIAPEKSFVREARVMTSRSYTSALPSCVIIERYAMRLFEATSKCDAGCRPSEIRTGSGVSSITSAYHTCGDVDAPARKNTPRELGAHTGLVGR